MTLGFYYWTYEVGAKLSASIFCFVLTIDENHMDNYVNIVILKIPMCILMVAVSSIVPKDENYKIRANQMKLESICGQFGHRFALRGLFSRQLCPFVAPFGGPFGPMLAL